MISIEVDGEEIRDKEHLFQIFRTALSLEDYYGCNLDALYDVLSTFSERVEISLENEETLYARVPFYGERLIEMIKVACEENEPNIILKLGEIEEELW